MLWCTDNQWLLCSVRQTSGRIVPDPLQKWKWTMYCEVTMATTVCTILICSMEQLRAWMVWLKMKACQSLVWDVKQSWLTRRWLSDMEDLCYYSQRTKGRCRTVVQLNLLHPSNTRNCWSHPHTSRGGPLQSRSSALFVLLYASSIIVESLYASSTIVESLMLWHLFANSFKFSIVQFELPDFTCRKEGVGMVTTVFIFILAAVDRSWQCRVGMHEIKC